MQLFYKNELLYNLGRVLACSFGFFLTYLAIYVVENTESEVYSDEGFAKLGFVSIAILYGSSGIFSFFAPWIV